MAVAAGAYLTYDATGNREDLANVIYNIDPIDCPVMASIGRGRATATRHDWQTDQLDAAAFNVNLEGDDTVFTLPVDTLRPYNYCQISDKDVMVSGTQEAVEKGGRTSELSYQLAKKMKSLKRDIEFTISRNQYLNIGARGTSRALASIEQWVASPAPTGGLVTSSLSTGTVAGVDAVTTDGVITTARVDGTQRPLLESQLKGVIQAIWQNGGDGSLIIAGGFNKATISSFTGNNTRYDISEDKRLVAAIDVYVSDFNSHRVVPSRFSRDRTVLVLTPSLLSVDYLRPFQQKELATTGDNMKRLLLAEYTLRVSNRFAQGGVFDLNTA